MLTLELIGGLVNSPTGLSESEWQALLAPLDPTDARVVVLTVLHGPEKGAVAELLGISRMRVYQRWDRALRRLRDSRAVRQLAG